MYRQIKCIVAFFPLTAVLCFGCNVLQPKSADAEGLKLDFGSGEPAAGYINVTPSSRYNEATGYGFENTPSLQAIERADGKDPAHDFITSDQPFFFSMKLPEGNYHVKVM